MDHSLSMWTIGQWSLMRSLWKCLIPTFPKLPGWCLSKKDAVVMHTFSISAATRVLLVLADPAMAFADVSSPLPILLEPGCHPCALHRLRLLNLWGGLRREEII